MKNRNEKFREKKNCIIKRKCECVSQHSTPCTVFVGVLSCIYHFSANDRVENIRGKNELNSSFFFYSSNFCCVRPNAFNFGVTMKKKSVIFVCVSERECGGRYGWRSCDLWCICVLD